MILIAKFIISIAIIASITFFAYSGTLESEFLHWDDQLYVIENPHIKSFSKENLYWMTGLHASNWHPLTWLSHALDYALYGLVPGGHHLTNVILHCFNTIGLFALVIVLITTGQTSSSKKTETPRRALIAAGTTALLFGIHPQHVEAVAWVAERKELLCLFFILLSVQAYVWYTRASLPGTRNYRYLLALLCFFLALTAKPMAVTLPVVLILVDIYPLKRLWFSGAATPVLDKTAYPELETKCAATIRGAFTNKKALLDKIPFFLLSLISIILTIMAQHQGGAIAHFEEISFQARILNAFNSIITYLTKLVFPTHFAPYYPYSDYSFYESYQAFLPVIGVLCLSILCVVQWYKKKYYWLISWLFYLVTLSPVIGIIQVGGQAAADRYTYLPCIPFYILAGAAVSGIYQRWKKRSIQSGVTIIFIAAVLALFHQTRQQTLVWRNNLVFWHYAVTAEPNTPVTHSNLARAYTFAGQHEKALLHYRISVTLNPAASDFIYFLLAGAYRNTGKLEEALEVYKYIIERNSDSNTPKDEIYADMGEIYFKKNRFKEAREAALKALEINPSQQKAKNLLSELSFAAEAFP
ncbi:MAG: tetratricopeptide repeat protein [Gammaproteobacteria bacterium]|nr:tetratricopeptide repeat protein [Gammaproteobacteria bacterium]